MWIIVFLFLSEGNVKSSWGFERERSMINCTIERTSIPFTYLLMIYIS